MGNRLLNRINWHWHEPMIFENYVTFDNPAPIMHRTEVSRAEAQAEYYNQRLNEAVNDIMQNAQLRDIFEVINNYPL